MIHKSFLIHLITGLNPFSEHKFRHDLQVPHNPIITALKISKFHLISDFQSSSVLHATNEFLLETKEIGKRF